MGSWGVSLNSVYLSGGLDPETNLSANCPVQNNVGCLTSPPLGLGLPGRRTEDVTFAQRDGVRHYSDWFEARIITLENVIICDDGCGGFNSSCSARQKVRDLLEAWNRNCCDTEVVIYTPCNSSIYDTVPTPQLITDRINYFSYNSRGQEYTNNCSTFEFTDTRGFGDATGSYSIFSENTDLPANISIPQLIARKTWNTAPISYCRNYAKCYSGTRTNLINNPSAETNSTGWSGPGGSIITRVTSISYSGSASIQTTIPSSAAPTTVGAQMGSISLAASTTYTLSAYVYVPTGTTDVQLSVQGTAVSSTVTGTSVSTKDEWVRTSVTFTTDGDGGTANCYVLNTSSTGATSQIFYVDAVLLEVGNTADNYFDGNTTDLPSHAYAWTGTANNSTSTDTFTESCYDQAQPGSNNNSGFLMGCTGQSGFSVTSGDTWTISGYLRSSISDVNLLVRVFFYDESGSVLASEEGTIEPSVANVWVRVSDTVTVPDGAATMQFALDTGDGGSLFSANDTLDATAVLVEKSSELGNYFDGEFTDADDPVLGGSKTLYTWEGVKWSSPSRERIYEYVAGRDRALNGPFGIVGRPRVAEVTWKGQGSSCASVLLRFDAVDHRMYVLDECGTPGYRECVDIEPGSVIKCRGYEEGTGAYTGQLVRCYSNAPNNTWCYDNDYPGSISVDPTSISVLGTLPAYPVITLNPSLTNPRIEDTITGKSITYQGKINSGEEPVIIYTEDMTAYQGETSVTHLLGGTLDFWLDPGNHNLRVLVQSVTDTGTVNVCWRPAVVAA